MAVGTVEISGLKDFATCLQPLQFLLGLQIISNQDSIFFPLPPDFLRLKSFGCFQILQQPTAESLGFYG